MKKNLMGIFISSLLLVSCSGGENEENKDNASGSKDPFQQKVDKVCNCFEEHQDDFLKFNEECGGLAEGLIESFKDNKEKDKFVNTIMDCKNKYNP